MRRDKNDESYFFKKYSFVPLPKRTIKCLKDARHCARSLKIKWSKIIIAIIIKTPLLVINLLIQLELTEGL